MNCEHGIKINECDLCYVLPKNPDLSSSAVMPGYGFSLDSVIAEKARPVDMRKALHVADEFKKAGILFVPMPVLNKKDGDELCTESFKRMDILERKAVLEA